MTAKTAFFSALGRTDQPRRETLRRELARTSPSEAEGAARPTLVLASASPRRLQLLSGRAHRVLTSVCLITPDDRVRHKMVDTRVRFKHLSREEIEAYIASREWRGKAGGYAIQGLAGCFVQKLTGSYTSVVGLPLTEVVSMLVGEGFPIHFAWVRAAELDPT